MIIKDTDYAYFAGVSVKQSDGTTEELASSAAVWGTKGGVIYYVITFEPPTTPTPVVTVTINVNTVGLQDWLPVREFYINRQDEPVNVNVVVPEVSDYLLPRDIDLNTSTVNGSTNLIAQCVDRILSDGFYGNDHPTLDKWTLNPTQVIELWFNKPFFADELEVLQNNSGVVPPAPPFYFLPTAIPTTVVSREYYDPDVGAWVPVAGLVNKIRKKIVGLRFTNIILGSVRLARVVLREYTPIQADVDVDTQSIERGGDDSMSADMDAKDTATGLQTTVTGRKGNLNQVLLASLANLFGPDVMAKMFAIDDTTGNLDAVKSHNNALLVDAEMKSNERSGTDSVSADLDGQDTLNDGGGGATIQKTITAIKQSRSLISSADKTGLWSILAHAILAGMAPNGDLKTLLTDESGIVRNTDYINGNDKTYEDASFIAGESPRTLDVNTDLGRNGKKGYIICDGPGDLQVEISKDGATWGGVHTMKQDEVFNFEGYTVDSIKLTHLGTDSGYRISVL
jgi:hypothetical protein